MKKYHTVKEVCAVTGLTRKHLYYFHHAGVVQAAGYANYSVEGNDGYKLYDDAGLEKLQQIALYYQLGMRRDEIRDMLQRPDYSSEGALRQLLRQKRAEHQRLERQIAALQFLLLTGLFRNPAGVLQVFPPEKLGRLLLEHPQSLAHTEKPSADPFRQGLADLLARPLSAACFAPPPEQTTHGVLAFGRRFFGKSGDVFALGYFAGLAGDGELNRAVSLLLSPQQKAHILRCLTFHPEWWIAANAPRGNCRSGG